MVDRHHFEKKPLNRHNLVTVLRIAMKFGMKTHFDILKKNLNPDSGRPIPGHVCGRYTQSHSPRDRTGTARMPMGCIGETWRIR